MSESIFDTFLKDNRLSDGMRLIKSLNLQEFKFVWVQKIINYPTSVFIITIDSYHPNTYLSMSRIKKAKSTIITNAKKYGDEVLIKEFKLTPPLDLWYAQINIKQDSLIIVRDLAGEYLQDDKMFECINSKNLKFKSIEKVL